MIKLLQSANTSLYIGLLKNTPRERWPLTLGREVSVEVLAARRFSRFTSPPSRQTFITPNPEQTYRTEKIRLIPYSILLGGIALQLLFFSQTYALDTPELPSTEKMDPATSIKFPTFLKLEGEPELTLLGVGVRTVSFLSIRVYSVGFYADLKGLDLKSLKLCKGAEERIETLLKTTTCALRIVPTRATSLSHLRDGFVRAIQARQALARKAGSLEAEQEEALHAPIQQFKGLFPTSAFKKHEPMHIVLSSPQIQPRHLRIPPLGTVKDTWVATEFFRAYFHGTISPPLIEDVKRGVNSIQSELRL